MSIITETIGIVPAMPAHAIPAVAHPQEACAWCWYTMHPGVYFPENESSTICSGHMQWMEMRYYTLVRERKAAQHEH